jgi:hypothetical protein
VTVLTVAGAIARIAYSADGYDPGASVPGGCKQSGNITFWVCPAPQPPKPAPQPTPQPQPLKLAADLLRRAGDEAEYSPAAARAEAMIAIDKLNAALRGARKGGH